MSSANVAVGDRLAKRFAKDARGPMAGADKHGELLTFGCAVLVESPLDGQI